MAQETEYGGFWVRVVALTLDNAIVFLIMLAVGIAMVTVKSIVGIDLPDFVVSLPFTLIPLFYWPVLESSSWQATVGKRIMGLQVTDLDGNRLSFLVAFLRSLAKIISAIPLGIGYLFAAFTARKQALHDLIVKTLVVRTGPSHLWKIILALIVGLAIMVASAVGFFYYVITPMFRHGGEGTMQEAMKSAPQAKAIPASVPTRKEPAQQMKPDAPAPQAAAPAAAPTKPEAKTEAMKVEPKPELKPAPKPETKKAEPTPTPKPEAKMIEQKPEPKVAPKSAPAPAKMEKEAVPQIETRPPAPASDTARRSRANEDARECLKLSTNSEIMRCAGKFR